jgi:hypothetical protein
MQVLLLFSRNTFSSLTLSMYAAISCPISSAPSNRPVSSTAPVSSNTASASIKPEPHSPLCALSPLPNGDSLPITDNSIPLSHFTWSIAPLTAAIPMVIPAPSKAGPAAVAQQKYIPSYFITISPFVPISRYMAGPDEPSSPAASIPAVISPPTYAEIAGV